MSTSEITNLGVFPKDLWLSGILPYCLENYKLRKVSKSIKILYDEALAERVGQIEARFKKLNLRVTLGELIFKKQESTVMFSHLRGFSSEFTTFKFIDILSYEALNNKIEQEDKIFFNFFKEAAQKNRWLESEKAQTVNEARSYLRQYSNNLESGYKNKKVINLRNLTLSLPILPSEFFHYLSPNLECISIEWSGLTNIPNSIGRFQHLKQLKLGCNELKFLPADIINLKALKKLKSNGNKFTTFQTEILYLTNLKKLDLSNNQIEFIPEEIECLINLTELILSDNKLTSLPNNIEKLANLKILIVSQNQLNSLPKIENLKKLERLLVQGNKLTSLPQDIINLKDLKTCIVCDNPLTSIPEEIMPILKSSISNLRFLSDFIGHKDKKKRTESEVFMKVNE
ncbi:MAG: leucine-rich repeat domain-containing protein [Chlamydiae bacterium]|nr:leucine-rich repeat domain-containing protein [Chlamydiota bacterium]